jgi:rubrerythrin
VVFYFTKTGGLIKMTELEKLKHLLEHWIEHNNAHVKTYSDWAEKAEALGEKELAGILDQIAEESRKLERLFNKALQKT